MGQLPHESSQSKSRSIEEIQCCNRYFNEYSYPSWSYRDFLSYYTAELGTEIRLDLVNSRYLKALEHIEDSPRRCPETKKKARSLIDKHRNAHQQRSQAQSDAKKAVPNFVVHGDIIHSGHDVTITNGNRTTVRKRASSSTAGPAKRRALAGSSKRDRTESEDKAAETINDPVCLGDMIEAGNDVQIINGDRVTRNVATDDDSTESPQPESPTDNAQSVLDPSITEFKSSFKRMGALRKLASGRILEKIIYSGVLNCFNDGGASSLKLKGNPILSWIIDLDDELISKWFEDDELAEIHESLPQLPEVDESFKYAVRRFSEAKSVQQLWSVIESSPRPPGEDYDRSKNFDATYVNTAAGSILSMMESLRSCEWLGPQGLREGWFGSNVWGPIVDRSLLGVDNLVVSRAEIKSKSESKENKRFDAIMLALAGIEVSEFGAIEVARTADAIGPKKKEIDSAKLQNILCSMLSQLMKQVDEDFQAIEHLQVVGIQHVGFTIQISRMSLVGKRVFLIQRGHPRTVPTTLGKFHSVFKIMQSMVVTKKILERSMGFITQYKAVGVSKGKKQFENFEL